MLLALPVQLVLPDLLVLRVQLVRLALSVYLEHLVLLALLAQPDLRDSRVRLV